MNSVRSNNESLKYQRFATLGSKDIEILNSEFVAKTQFLFIFINQRLFYAILELCITFNKSILNQWKREQWKSL